MNFHLSILSIREAGEQYSLQHQNLTGDLAGYQNRTTLDRAGNEQRVPCAFWTPARWACLVIEGVQKLAQIQISYSACFCAATESLLLNYPEPAPILAMIVSA
jgi:hypothetical protein